MSCIHWGVWGYFMWESGSKGEAESQPQQISATQERKAVVGTKCGSLVVNNNVQPLEGMHSLSIGFAPGILSGKLFPRLCSVRALRDAHSSSLLWGALPGWCTDLCCAYQHFIFLASCNCCLLGHFGSPTARWWYFVSGDGWAVHRPRFTVSLSTPAGPGGRSGSWEI